MGLKKRCFFKYNPMNFNSAKHVYKWYAVYTKSRFEKKLYSELVNKGIECYLPLKSEKRQLSDRVKIVEEPLIRGYFFYQS